MLAAPCLFGEQSGNTGKELNKLAQIVEAHKDEMSGNGPGLHWEALDEDISVEGLLMGIGDQTQNHSLAA